ncbi:MAG: hypothetical protein LAN37_12620 [Acidobacteriia bacterium]|nr:hypothetical protein [Terriglobia bacterium]
MPKKSFSVLLVILFALETAAWGGLGNNKTMYVGGTINDIKEKTEGVSSTADEKIFVFDYKGGKLTIPYSQIDSLEYGQKAGRRVGAAIAISPLFLLSKKRRHYLTISFTDGNKKQQAAVLEIGKDAIKPTLAALETKTGKKIEYQDEEARKTATGK